MIRIYFLFVLLFASSLSFAQNKGTATLTDPCLDTKGNAYMDRQAGAFLHEIDAALKKYPPKLSITSSTKANPFAASGCRIA